MGTSCVAVSLPVVLHSNINLRGIQSLNQHTSSDVILSTPRDMQTWLPVTVVMLTSVVTSLPIVHANGRAARAVLKPNPGCLDCGFRGQVCCGNECMDKDKCAAKLDLAVDSYSGPTVDPTNNDIWGVGCDECGITPEYVCCVSVNQCRPRGS